MQRLLRYIVNSFHADTLQAHTGQFGSVPCIDTVTGGKKYLAVVSKDACMYLTNVIKFITLEKKSHKMYFKHTV